MLEDLAIAPSGLSSVPRTVCQGAQGNLPFMGWVVEIQTSVPAAVPKLACDLTPAPLNSCSEALENTGLVNYYG